MLGLGLGIHKNNRYFGGLWTPSMLGGKELWLDGADSSTIVLNGSNVSQWSDKSGNDNHAVQSVAADQPSYANKTLTFNGATASENLYISEPTGINNARMNMFTLKKSSCDSCVLFWNGINVFALVYRSTSSSTPYANFGVPTFYDSGTEISLPTRALSYSAFQDGVYHIESYVGSTTAWTESSSKINIGGYADFELDADIQEILWVSGTMTTDERQKTEGYLAWKWGLQSKLPVGHPYKDAAPRK